MMVSFPAVVVAGIGRHLSDTACKQQGDIATRKRERKLI